MEQKRLQFFDVAEWQIRSQEVTADYLPSCFGQIAHMGTVEKIQLNKN